MEYRFFDGDVPYVSTAEFHRDRDRAPHLEQPAHKLRLHKAHEFIRMAATQFGVRTVTDLGCGDGGLLSLLARDPDITFDAWGYDFQPSNAAGWKERRVTASLLDVFHPEGRKSVEVGDIAVTTEVLEHLADPHGVLRWLSSRSLCLVASSPWNETPESHDACHAWGWDKPGYHSLINNNGWQRTACAIIGQFHVVAARSTSR